MPTRLTPEVVADALTALHGWTGNEDRISRRVPLEPEQAAQLKVFVAESADSMDHHPVVEDGDGATTFVLWTHTQGGVTELDIALAARIDDLVTQVCGVPPTVDQPEEGQEAQAGATIHAEQERAVDVVADQRRSGEGHYREGQGEPVVGVVSASGGQPATPLPDVAPDEPEPGVESPGGRQGGGPG
jgi:4a-hydroxytetrahydrobiopterin dehydratase